jgi:two-component system, chemotaxis family, sensor kinase CheA
MKIKSKVLLAFSLIFLTILFLLTISIATIKKMNHSADEIVNVEYTKVELATTIRNEVSTLGKALRDYVLSDTNAFKEDQLTKINQARDNGGGALLNLEKITFDTQGALIINHLKTVGADYLKFQEDVISKAKTGMVSEASDMLTIDAGKYQQNLFELVEDLININKISMLNAVKDSKGIYNQALLQLWSVTILYLILSTVLAIILTKRLTNGLAKVSNVMEGFSQGTYGLDTRLEVNLNDEVGTVSKAFNKMAASLQGQALREKELSSQINERFWLNEKITRVFTLIQDMDNVQDVAERTLSEIMPHLGAAYGVIYLSTEIDGVTMLKKMASYAVGEMQVLKQDHTLSLGEGLVGQCAIEKKPILLSDVPPEYYIIQSGLGLTAPREVMISPFLINQDLEGVIEVASLQKFSSIQMEYLTQLSLLLAIHIHKIKDKMKIEALYVQAQRVTQDLRVQSDELLLQQEELVQMNAELEEQTAALEESEQQLQSQHIALENLNETLRDKSSKLEEQNTLLKQTMIDLEHKSEALSDAIVYKSLFLANMSHELRTPLNSMLILTKLLAENKENNLSPKQVEYASIVYSSGCDLLTLINEILELAKLESKKTEISYERIELQQVVDFVQRNFEAMAQQRGLQFNIVLEESLPQAFYSDQQRLLQILQNLLSNAFKFTEQGSVTFSVISNHRADDLFHKPNMKRLEFIVADTGIGIEPGNLEVIFDAFVQADGSTSRKYGGTGLGLSISREFSILLGGEIVLQSHNGQGSVFTLSLPVEIILEPITVDVETPILPIRATPTRRLEDKLILIVDDDVRNVFALTSIIESYGLTALYAENGLDAIVLLDKHPDIDAILMDIMMPEMDGYEAIRQIRLIPQYQTLPIIAVTAKAMKDDRDKCIQAGASDYITKPVDINQLFSLLKVWLYA